MIAVEESRLDVETPEDLKLWRIFTYTQLQQVMSSSAHVQGWKLQAVDGDQGPAQVTGHNWLIYTVLYLVAPPAAASTPCALEAEL